MAELAKDPKGLELEDFVAAHFVSRGCYVETGVKERNPDEILELDLVWTDYRKEPQTRRPVEIKSGEWGLGDVFKFFGWTKYLGLEPGEFVYKEPCGRLSTESIEHVHKRTGISFFQVAKPEDIEDSFKKLGLPDPPWSGLSAIWRFSFGLQRRLLKSLSESIRRGTCTECAKSAKEYHQLINDAVFFIPDICDRIGELLSAHFSHQKLALSTACEIETGKVDLEDPPQTKTFRRSYFEGTHFPIQACLYLAHRARLYLLKTVVDYWLARERGELKSTKLKIGETLIDLTSGRLPASMANGIEELSAMKSFRMFPVFWQVFLWSWGGFVCKDRLEEEYKALSLETGVEIEEIPVALTAFDKLFPTSGGWFREPDNDSRRVLILMPAAMRGLGAFRRKQFRKVEEYKDLAFKDATADRMVKDHNCGARLLDCTPPELAT